MPALQALFSRIVQPTPPFYRAAVLRMIRDYQGNFHRDTVELATLDAFLGQSEIPRLLLLAPTGRGKTAMLIHWLARIAREGEWHTIFIPISLRYQIASPRITLRALAQSLAAFHNDQEYLHIYNMSPDQLRPVIANYLRTDAPPGRRLLLVLDGVDETVGWSIARDILPMSLGANLHIVASARAATEQTDAIAQAWLQHLGWKPASTHVMPLARLSHSAEDAMLDDLCATCGGMAASVQIRADIHRISEGDPLIMQLLVRALQEGILDAAQLSQLSPGLEDYVQHWLKTLEDASPHASAVYMLIGLCAMARGTLSIDDLCELAPDVFTSEAMVQQVAHTLNGFLTGDGSTHNGYVFDHLRLREIFREHVFSQREQRQFQQRFVQYGQEWYAGKRSSLTSYVRRYWVEHLAEAAAWEQLESVLTAIVPRDGGLVQPWVEARFRVEGNYVGFLGDLDILWRWNEQHKRIVPGVRSGLIASTLRNTSGNLLPELLEQLVTVGTPAGRWSMGLALRQVRQMSAPGQKLKALKRLLAKPHPLPNPRPHQDAGGNVRAGFTAKAQRAQRSGQEIGVTTRVHQDAGGNVRPTPGSAGGSPAPGRGLALPNPYPNTQTTVSPDHDLVLDVVYSFTDDRWRAEALAVVVPLLGEQQVPTLLRLARAMDDSEARIRSFAAIVPLLRQEEQVAEQSALYDEIFTLLGDLKERLQTRLLAGIIPPLPADLLPQAHAIIRAMSSEKWRSEALQILAVHPAAPQWNDIAQDALAFAHALLDKQQFAEALPILTLHTPVHEQSALLAHMQATIRAIPHAGARSLALVALAPYLPAEQQPACYQDALTAAQAIASRKQQVRVLATILPHLPTRQQQTVASEQLAIACEIADERERADVLSVLGHLVTFGQEPRIARIPRITVAVGVQLAAPLQQPQHGPTESSRQGGSRGLPLANPDGLPAASPDHSEESGGGALLDNALAAARAIAEDRWRVAALMALLPHLPEQQQHPVALECLHAARTLGDEWQRSEVLIALAPKVPPPLRPELLAAIRTIADEWQRAETLTAVAPAFPHAEQQQLYAESLVACRALIDRWQVLSWLVALLPHLPTAHRPPLLDELLARMYALPDEQQRTDALLALAPHLKGDEYSEVYRDMLASMQPVLTQKWGVDALLQLLPHVPPRLHDEALGLVHTLAAPWHRVHALAMLAPHLSPDVQTTVYRDILATARQELDAWQQTELLRLCAAHVPQPLHTDMLAIACAIGHELHRTHALTALLPHLIAEQQTVALRSLLETVTNVNWIVETLPAIVPHMPPALLQEILAWADGLQDSDDRARVLSNLLPSLATEQQETFVPVVLSSVSSIGYVKWRADVLVALAPYLPATLLPEAMQQARTIRDPEEQTRVLTALAPHRPATLLPEALAAARGIADEEQRVHALLALVDDLPPMLVRECLAAIQEIQDNDLRVNALVALAPHASPAQQATIYEHALEPARTAGNSEQGVRNLCLLASHLPMEQQPMVYAEALATTRTMTDTREQMAMLSTLAQELAEWSTLSTTNMESSLALWQANMRFLASYGRADLLSSLAALTPWLSVLVSASALVEIADTLLEVVQCWP